MTSREERRAELAEALEQQGEVSIGWSRPALVFFIASSGVFALYALAGLVIRVGHRLGADTSDSLGDLPILLFLLVVPGVVCVRFVVRWRRAPVPLRISTHGVRIVTPYGPHEVTWLDIAEVNARRSFSGQALELVMSTSWCAAHPKVRVRASAVDRSRVALVLEAATSPPAWTLVPWLDQEARTRGGGPRLS